MQEMTRKNLQAFSLPLSVVFIIPGIILFCSARAASFWGLHFWHIPLQLTWGAIFISVGSALGIASWRLFIKIGEGTPAPWNPPRKLVICGPYLHTRNPMISGVLFILLGESVIFGSGAIFLWFLLFLVGNTIYFASIEEPGLEKRFGSDYAEYKKHVPRWIPLLKPWNKENTPQCPGTQ